MFSGNLNYHEPSLEEFEYAATQDLEVYDSQNGVNDLNDSQIANCFAESCGEKGEVRKNPQENLKEFTQVSSRDVFRIFMFFKLLN